MYFIFSEGIHALRALAVLPLAPIPFFQAEPLRIFPDL